MKKLFLLLGLSVVATGVGLSIMNKSTPVYADEILPPDTQPSVIIIDEPEEDEETTALEEVKSWLNQHMDKQMVANIITWVSEAGVLSGLLGVYIKYHKFKYKTLEDLVKLVKDEVGKYLTENFEKLSTDKIDNIVKSIDDLEKANETIMKVLVLMQDTSKKGKVALLDFLGSKTNNEEIKEMAENASEELEEEVKVEEEVKEAVKEEYKQIF